MQNGRPPALNGQDLALIAKLYFEEMYTVREIADWTGVSHMTVWRALQKIDETEKFGGE